MSRCRLCLRDERLRESHILPEFAYRPTYDQDHTAITFEEDSRLSGTRRRGYWEELLCGDCEQHIAKWESYFAAAWFHSPLRPRTLSGETATVSGLGYSRFKLTLLSILWRASVSSLAQFRQVSLGPHQDRLRQLLVDSQPGPEDRYPIGGLALRDPDTGGFQDALVQLPASARIAGHSVYKMLFGGVFWFVGVSSHKAGQPVPVCLRADGSLTLQVQDWSANASIRGMAALVQRSLKNRGRPAV